MSQFLEVFQVFGYLFVLLASVFALIASASVKSTFKRYDRVMTRRGVTGAEAARRVLAQNGVQGVGIARTPGKLTDHFDPKTNTVYLSESVYDSASASAVGVAAHEAGHAVQYAAGYLPIRIRSAIIPVTNIGSRLAMPLILAGLLIMAYRDSSFGYELAMAGVFGYALMVLFQLVTLPTEFNASRRAVSALRDGGLLDEDELIGAKKTLRAAAMTYVAALAVSLLQLLRLLALVSGQRGRRR